MSLWNPYAFTPTGQRTSVSAPPALRCIGGKPTPAQLGMAQAAFAAFCGRSRVSFWQNPNEQGRLPDGTVYRIVSVGNQQIMQIWPMSSEDRQPFRLLYPLGFTYGRVSSVNDEDLWISEGDERLRSVICHDKVLSSWELNKLTKSVTGSDKIFVEQDSMLNRMHAKAWSHDGKKAVVLPAMVGEKSACLGTYLHGRVYHNTSTGYASILTEGGTAVATTQSAPFTPYTELINLGAEAIQEVPRPAGLEYSPLYGPAKLRNAAILHGGDRMYDLLTGIKLKDCALFTPEGGPRCMIRLVGTDGVSVDHGESFDLEVNVHCLRQAPVEGATDESFSVIHTFKQKVMGGGEWVNQLVVLRRILAYSPNGAKMVYALYAHQSVAEDSSINDIRATAGVYAAWEFSFTYQKNTGLIKVDVVQIVQPSDTRVTVEDIPDPEPKIQRNTTYNYQYTEEHPSGSTAIFTRKADFKNVEIDLWDYAGSDTTPFEIDLDSYVTYGRYKYETYRVLLVGYGADNQVSVLHYLRTESRTGELTQTQMRGGEYGPLDKKSAPFPASLTWVTTWNGSASTEDGSGYYSVGAVDYEAFRSYKDTHEFRKNGAVLAKYEAHQSMTGSGNYVSIASVYGTAGVDSWQENHMTNSNKVESADLFSVGYRIASNSTVFVQKFSRNAPYGLIEEFAITPEGSRSIYRTNSQKAAAPWCAWNPITNEITLDDRTSWC